MPQASRPSKLIASVGIACVAIAGAGVIAMGAYAEAPGHAASAHEHLPAAIDARGRVATLVVAIHPGCPCTDATAEALARLARQWHAGDVVVHALIAGPAADEGVVLRAHVNRQLAYLPDVHVRTDAGGLAWSLGARTSGHVFAFDADGALRFSGGITPGRGHRGESEGLRALRALATPGNRIETTLETPVYGCSIFGDEHRTAADGLAADASCPLCTED